MKITNISANSYSGTDVSVSVNFQFEDGTSLSSALASVEALVAGVSVSRDTSAPSPTQASVASEPVADTGASTARTRRPRTAPAATPDPTPPAEPATVTDIGTRRRRAAAPEAEGPKVYSDVDMSKAASNAAAAIIAFGDKGGTDIVKAVLADYGATTTSDIPADKREQFLKDLAEEVEAAGLERAKLDAEAASA